MTLFNWIFGNNEQFARGDWGRRLALVAVAVGVITLAVMQPLLDALAG